jgi:hypothetical protein
MQETLGIIFIGMAAVLMIAVGIYGLAPIVLAARRRDVIDWAESQEDLLESVRPGIDKGMIEELFAELLQVRTAIAELTAQTRETAEEQTEAPTTAAAGLDTPSSSWNAVDQGAVEELFAELFSIRTAVASMSGELRGLRESIQTATEPKRRRPSTKAA